MCNMLVHEIDLLISPLTLSWDLDWRYLVAYLLAMFDKDTLVWLDILACSQHQIGNGDMSEIKQLPAVVDYAGKTLVMPGTVKRLWCIYEFAWSIELNGGSLFYGYSDAELGVGASLMAAVGQLVEQDTRLLKEDDSTEFMSQAACFKESDQSYIHSTIGTRLGGKDRVAGVVKKKLRAALGIETSWATPTDDRDALTQLFVQSDGENWKNRGNWLDDKKPLEEWHGVSCNQAGRVSKLELEDNGLTVLGAAIGALASLTCLDLDNNQLTSLPDSIGGLTALTQLYVATNQLISLPDSFSGLEALSVMNIAKNRLAPGVAKRLRVKLPHATIDSK